MPTPSEPGPGPDIPWYIPEWMLGATDSGPTGSAPDRTRPAGTTGRPWSDSQAQRPRAGGTGTGRLAGGASTGSATGAGEGDGRWLDYWAYEAHEPHGPGWDARWRRGPRAGESAGEPGDAPHTGGSVAWRGAGEGRGGAGPRVAEAVREGLPFMIGMALVLVTATRPDLVSVSAICAATGFVVGLFVDAVLERAASPRPRKLVAGVTLARLLRRFGRLF